MELTNEHRLIINAINNNDVDYLNKMITFNFYSYRHLFFKENINLFKKKTNFLYFCLGCYYHGLLQFNKAKKFYKLSYRLHKLRYTSNNALATMYSNLILNKIKKYKYYYLKSFPNLDTKIYLDIQNISKYYINKYKSLKYSLGYENWFNIFDIINKKYCINLIFMKI